MKESIKELLKKTRIGRLIYEPLHKIYRLYSVPHRRRVLRKNGVVALAHIVDVLERRKIPAYAAYGTMLGFVRDHGFIPNDDDIDIGVMPGEWTPSRLMRILTEEEGFGFVFAFSYKGRITEFKLVYNGVPVDFFFYERRQDNFFAHAYYYEYTVNYPSEKANTAKLITEPAVDEIGFVKVFGMDVPVPSNYEYVAEALYGKTWRIPNSEWDDSMHPTIVTLPEFGFSETKEFVLAGW